MQEYCTDNAAGGVLNDLQQTKREHTNKTNFPAEIALQVL